MRIIKNATVKNSDSGFFLNGSFNGLTYYVGSPSGGIVKLYPIEVPQRPMDIELSTLTLQDSGGTGTTPADEQDRAALLNSYVSKKKSIASGGAVNPNHRFVDVAARDAYFTTNFLELFPGIEIILIDDGAGATRLETWVGEGQLTSYPASPNDLWFFGTGATLTAGQVKTLYESNNDTNALIDAKLAILNQLTTDGDSIRSAVSWIFPAGSVIISDSVISSGGRMFAVRSLSTGNEGSLVIQLFTDDNYIEPTVVDHTVSAEIFQVQTTDDTIESGTSETNVRQVVQNSIQTMRFRFKPVGDAVTASFSFQLRITATGQPVYDEIIDPANLRTITRTGANLPELRSVGNGIWELILISPSQLDAGFDAYIRTDDLNLLGGNGYDGTDGVRYGDASKADFFPWLEVKSIPVNRIPIISQPYVDNADGLLQDQITTIQSTVLNSGRAFTTFNDSFVIDDTNILTYEDRNNIYAAKIDKIVDVFLPSNADIAAAGTAYPIAFEFTHLGGTAIIPGNNLLRIYIADANIVLSADLVDFLVINQLVIITKASASDDWVASKSLLDPMSTILPSGVFDIQIGVAADIPTIDVDFAGLTIGAGYAYIVTTGGTRFGADIEERDVIVALTGTPSLAVNSVDWLVISSKVGRSLTTDEVLFFNQLTRDGIRFDLSQNVFINDKNVVIQSYLGQNAPSNSGVFITPNSQNEETVTLTGLDIQFTNLVGGRLTLEYDIRTAAQSGFSPEFRSIEFEYANGVKFSFNIIGQGIDGVNTLSIDIPNADYSTSLNTTPTVRLVYIERGFQWVGHVAILSMTNVLKGTLHDSIVDLIASESAPLQTELRTDVSRIDSSIRSVNNSLVDIVGRLDNPVLSIPSEVVGILKNDITVTQENNVQLVPSDYNMMLGAGVAIGAIEEENSPTQVPNFTNSATIGSAGTGRRGQKLFYPVISLADGDALLTASGVDLIAREGNSLVTRQFVPSHGGGSRSVIHYPAPPNNFGSAGRWFLLSLKTATFQPVSSEISLTNEIPTTSTIVTIYTRILVNGNNVDAESHTLTVGGADTIVNFVENSGGELVDVTINYRSRFNDIEVQAVPRQVTGLAIADLEFRAEWTEVVTESSTPQTTRDIVIYDYMDNTQFPIAMKPSIDRVDNNGATLIIVTPRGEFDTLWTFNNLFNSDDSGRMIFSVIDVPIYDLIFSPNQLILTDLNSRLRNPFFGLFTENHTHLSIVNLDTGLRVSGLFGVPKLTVVQRNALSADNGDIVYNTDDKMFNFYEDDAWVSKI